MQPGLRQIGDAIEDVGEPGLGVDVVELGGADEGVKVGVIMYRGGGADDLRPPMVALSAA